MGPPSLQRGKRLNRRQARRFFSAREMVSASLHAGKRE
jgi:hypothetical protein